MKKFLLLGLAATMSIAASAQSLTYLPASGRIDISENAYPLGAKQITFSWTGSFELNPNAKGEFAIYVDGSETPAETKPATAAVMDSMGYPLASVVFSGTYNYPGEYRVLIPAGFCTVNGVPNEAAELKYYIMEDYTVTPPSGSVAESFQEWIFEALDAEEIQVNFVPFIGLDGSSEEYNLKYEILQQEGVNPNRVRFYLDEPLTTSGTWRFQMDEGALTFIKHGPQYAENPEDVTVSKSLEKRMVFYVATSPKFLVNPQEGVVEDFQKFEFTMPEGFSLTMADTMCTSYIYQYDENGNYTRPLAAVRPFFEQGTPANHANLYVCNPDNISQKIAEPWNPGPGKYTLVLAAGTFFGSYNGKTVSSSPYTYVYEIKTNTFEVVADPESGSKVGKIETITLNFPNAEFLNANEAEDAPKGVVKKDGVALANAVELSTEGGVSPYAAGLSATMTINPAITEDGTYTIELPEGCFMSGDLLSPAYSFTYVCDSNLGIAGVDADAESFDVYTMTGIAVLRGADASAVEALPAGLYIINGKKVVIK